MIRSPLYPALRAAVLARRVTDLRRLLVTHGVIAFADLIRNCPPRIADDALSLLGEADRRAVLARLPTSVRHRLHSGRHQGRHPIINPQLSRLRSRLSSAVEGPRS